MKHIKYRANSTESDNRAKPKYISKHSKDKHYHTCFKKICQYGIHRTGKIQKKNAHN